MQQFCVGGLKLYLFASNKKVDHAVPLYAVLYVVSSLILDNWFDLLVSGNIKTPLDIMTDNETRHELVS